MPEIRRTGHNSKEGVSQWPLVTRGRGCSDCRRVLGTIDDASNMVAALSVNLNWIEKALSDDGSVLGLVQQLRQSVEVCQKLTGLLSGAISSSRGAIMPELALSEPALLRHAIEIARARVKVLAETRECTITVECAHGHSVMVDRGLLTGALASLFSSLLNVGLRGTTLRVQVDTTGAQVLLAASVQIGSATAEDGIAVRKSGPRWTEYQTKVDAVMATFSSSFTDVLASVGCRFDMDCSSEGELTAYLILPVEPGHIGAVSVDGIGLAQGSTIERGGATTSGQKWSEAMIVNSDRFGAIEVAAEDLLSFPTGIVGFPRDNEFVLIRKSDSQVVGWLQSTRTSYLTLPVVSAHALAPRFPDVPIEGFAERAGLGSNIDELAVLAVLSAPSGQPATVNLMAPIIVNAVTRVGAQVLLEGTRFTTRELFVITATPVSSTSSDNETEPRNNSTSETQAVHSATSAAE